MSTRYGRPSRSSASSVTASGRSTSPYMSGIERQPSSTVSVASLACTMRGLMRTSGGGLSSPTSTTATRRGLPTWFAARPTPFAARIVSRSEEHTSELQSRLHLVCRLLLEKKKKHHDLHPPL